MQNDTSDTITVLSIFIIPIIAYKIINKYKKNNRMNKGNTSPVFLVTSFNVFTAETLPSTTS